MNRSSHSIDSRSLCVTDMEVRPGIRRETLVDQSTSMEEALAGLKAERMI